MPVIHKLGARGREVASCKDVRMSERQDGSVFRTRLRERLSANPYARRALAMIVVGATLLVLATILAIVAL